MQLKYGCNPNQSPASITVPVGELPLRVLNGSPGYINLLDALNGWQLVRELKEALGLPAAASYKHTSPAGAAVGEELTQTQRSMYFVGEREVSPLAAAYIRARGADRLSSFGDFAALSDVCDLSTALYLKGEVSDGVIAPGFTPEALEVLKAKRGGAYTVLMIDPGFEPPELERRELFGFTFTQKRNGARIGPDLFQNVVTREKTLTDEAIRDLTVAMITLKYTQSNSVCYAEGGQAIGVGAGQQSRIHCTRLAGNKADIWHLRQHPAVLSLPFLEGVSRPVRDNTIDLFLCDEDIPGWERVFSTLPARLTACDKRAWLDGFRSVALASDAFFPFSDNIDRAVLSGVRYIAQPGGSVRDEDVVAACDTHGITMCMTGLRLFYH